MHSRKLLLCLALALVKSLPAHADPVVITSGNATAYWDQSLSAATLSGEGFSVSGNGRGSSPIVWFVGEMGNLDGEWHFDLATVGFPPRQVTVDGATFLAVLRGGFTATTVPFVVPPFGTVDVFATPFTATGRVQGFAPSDPSQLLFDVAIIGGGTAHVSPRPVTGENFYLNDHTAVTYEFAAQSVEPVPEPATLLLVGGGLAGLAFSPQTPALTIECTRVAERLALALHRKFQQRDP
jgi:PEP-CTERM motif